LDITYIATNLFAEIWFSILHLFLHLKYCWQSSTKSS